MLVYLRLFKKQSPNASKGFGHVIVHFISIHASALHFSVVVCFEFTTSRAWVLLAATPHWNKNRVTRKCCSWSGSLVAQWQHDFLSISRKWLCVCCGEVFVCCAGNYTGPVAWFQDFLKSLHRCVGWCWMFCRIVKRGNQPIVCRWVAEQPHCFHVYRVLLWT